MFLHSLGDQEKKAFLVLAKLLANEDGRVDDRELQLIDLFLVETGLTKGDIPTDLAMESAIQKFQTAKSRYSCLIELVGLALSDLDYAEEERAFINKIADHFSIGEQNLLSIENWVRRMLALALEAERFWEKEI